MIIQGLLDHLNRLVVVLGTLLEDHHILFKSSDKSAVVFLFLNGIGLWSGFWLESLGHDSNAFLLNELAQLLEVLGDAGLGIVPHTHSVIFETGGQPVLGRELEHFSLALADALDGIGLRLVDLVYDVLESTLDFVV